MHALAMRHIDEVERRVTNEILLSRLRTDIPWQMPYERVSLRLLEADTVWHRRVDIDDHEVAPVGRGAIAAPAINSERSPQQIGQNLIRNRAGGRLARTLT